MIADVELNSTASVAAAPKSQTILGDGWIVIEPGNQIVLRVASSEIGQGVGTTMVALIAQELEVGAQHTWRGARVETSQARKRLLACTEGACSTYARLGFRPQLKQFHCARFAASPSRL
jgi:hypothetical protein